MTRSRLIKIACLMVLGILADHLMSSRGLADDSRLFRIDVVEQKTGWAVPLVELTTTSGLRFVSDNAGVIAVDAPELMGQDVWFHVRGQGYEVPADGFGIRGVRLRPMSGERAQVKVTRTTIAQRVGRLTGAGRLSELARFQPDPKVRETGIVGCDSVQMVPYQGKLFWIWGDTNLPHYPLGIFHASSATSGVPAESTLKPPVDLEYDYFRDHDGRPRGVAHLPGPGPTWLYGLTTVKNQQGDSELVSAYIKVEPPLTAWQYGLCRWNAKTQNFEVDRVLWTKDKDQPSAKPILQAGHAVHWQDGDGKSWILVGNPFPTVQIPDEYEAWRDPSTWRAHSPAKKLLSTTGETVVPHSGSLAWNPYRQRWAAILVQFGGSPSSLGEIWYTESESPFGPWSAAVKVLSHQNYSFYNPRIDAEFSAAESPYLYFEGTYTTLFADTTRDGSLSPSYPTPTPRYDYNQILYRVDLRTVRETLASE